MQSQQTLAERTEESTQDHKVWHQSENALEKFRTLGSHITSLEDALPLKPGIFLDPNPVPSPPPEISLGLKGSAECTALHILRGCVQNSRKGQYEKGVQDLSSRKREKPCIHVHHVRTLTLSEAKWPEGDVRRCEEMCKMAWCPYLQLQLLLCTAQSCQTQGCHGLCVQKTDTVDETWDRKFNAPTIDTAICVYSKSHLLSLPENIQKSPSMLAFDLKDS